MYCFFVHQLYLSIAVKKLKDPISKNPKKQQQKQGLQTLGLSEIEQEAVMLSLIMAKNRNLYKVT